MYAASGKSTVWTRSRRGILHSPGLFVNHVTIRLFQLIEGLDTFLGGGGLQLFYAQGEIVAEDDGRIVALLSRVPDERLHWAGKFRGVWLAQQVDRLLISPGGVVLEHDAKTDRVRSGFGREGKATRGFRRSVLGRSKC